MSQIKKVFIVDDHQLVIDGLKMLLSQHPDYLVVGESNQPLLAVEKMRSLKPDILLTDVSMKGLSGIELSRLVRNQFPEIKILALSMFGDAQIISEMIDAGIDGYILKNTGYEELITALEKLSIGQAYFSAAITQNLARTVKEQEDKTSLTDREIEIIRLIEQEYSNKQMAAQLFVSERTIETHRKNIFRKTNTQTVVGLLKYAYDRKII